MAIRSCKECGIGRAGNCVWLKTKNAAMIGECVTNPNWGGACATCSKGAGNDPNPALQLCRGCLANTRLGTTYFTGWTKR